MSDTILVLNAGSSSIKTALFVIQGDNLEQIYQGHISGIGVKTHFQMKQANGNVLVEQDLADADHEAAVKVLLDWLHSHDDGYTLRVVGHRVVHGGLEYTSPVLIDDEALGKLKELTPLAPLHQPHNLKPIQLIKRSHPDLAQIACFDTAFHTAQPAVAQRFALPRKHEERGVRRYGFHGSSYEYIARRLPELAGGMPEKVVVAHLGNGASMAAIKDGKSLASTMGFTALDGLPMGTRTGNIDPGVLLHFMYQGMTAKELENLLYKESGLLGLSGISNDMSVLLQSDAPEAKEAIEYFVYRITRELGSLVAALGGLDALVFTAGIGEHAAPIREMVCQQAAWLGLHLDHSANQVHANCISRADSAVSVWVIPTDEEKMIALHARELTGL